MILDLGSPLCLSEDLPTTDNQNDYEHLEQDLGSRPWY